MSHEHPADPVLLEQHQGLARITLNRPAQYNALSEEVLGSLQHILDTLAQDPSLQCVIIQATGKAFCAGHDLKQMRANPEHTYYRDLFSRCSRVMQGVLALPVPVIARVQGLATAAGCQLVATCDMAVASESTRFAVSGINVGLFCSTPAVALSRCVPPKAAMEMLMTGEFISAQRAQELGLINYAVAEDQLDQTIQKLADSILAKSPVAVRAGKAMFYRQRSLAIEQAYDYAGQVMADNMMSNDACEGIDAFIEKRAPQWRGT
ncbi:enoyl-CoA hydratase [Alcaligenes pakistanensis]|uniref:Enoyl-CoA hydratase domain-containing protein 3, mitochondrial n=1 Tax=Alcaligenes pakistanensis TaxID=1482717 RepID=A0A8H9ISW1_9BURK|nr:enoyl-CoA hydratase [Alcaligenes pakistanensis]GHC58124.1 enoyl-CoA hydratase [Alcaligenes pakistanensis]HCA16179.1 enoyl-CoA hydratase [Alcaligenes faecalis]